MLDQTKQAAEPARWEGATVHDLLEGYVDFRMQQRREAGVSKAATAIVMADDKYDDYVRNVDFIRAYIFPGGCLPSVSALTSEASKSGLQLTRMEEFGPHYAETLRRWRCRFDENHAAIRALGFDERFMRMWDYYLRYCEAAFDEHQVGLVQMVFEHRDRSEPPYKAGTSNSTMTGVESSAGTTISKPLVSPRRYFSGT